MAATVTLLGSTFNTTSGTHTVVATPAVNDLIVIVRSATGNTTATAPTDNNSSGTYTLIKSALQNTSANLLEIYARTALVGSASSTTFTEAPGTTTGGGLAVYKITGMSVAGLAAIRQSAAQANQAPTLAPAPAFGSAALTTNPIISAVLNGTNPAGITARSSPAYTRDVNTGYTTPASGIDTMHIASGETSSTITWASTSATVYASVAVELAFNQSPSAPTLTSPTNAGTVATTTPTLDFSTTDADSDDITYEVQVDTVNTFDSQGTGGGIGPAQAQAQSWTAGTSYTTGAIDLELSKVGSPADNLLVNITTSIGGTSIASGSIAGTSLTGTNTITNITLTGVSIVSGTKYYIQITRSGTRDTSNYYVANGVTSNSYGSGGQYQEDDASWSSESASNDLFFRLYNNSLVIVTTDRNASTGTFNGSIQGGIGIPLIDAYSASGGHDAADFTDVTNGADTDPFASGDALSFTLPGGEALTNSTTYYWRARGIDPSGTNNFGSWSSTFSFTVSTGGGGQSISATGIASTAALGSPTLSSTYNLAPTGLASTAALGAPTLAPGPVNVSPTGIASTAALGSPTVTSNYPLSVTGIGSTSALGSPTLTPGAVSLSPTGLASTAALGSPTLSPGAVNISLTGIASTSALGSPSVTPSQFITTSGIGSTLALGAPTLSSTYILATTGIASTLAFGSPTLSPGAVSISPSGLASTAALGSVTLLSVYILGPTGIASTAAYGSPTLSPGAVTISPTGLASTAALGSPTLSSAFTFSVSGIGSTLAFGIPTVAIGAGNLTLIPTGLASTLAFGLPVLVPGAVSITLTGIASTAALGTVTLTSFHSLSPTGIASTNAFGSPTLTPGVVAILPTGIVSTLVFGHLFVGILWPSGNPGGSGIWIPDTDNSATFNPGSGDGSTVWVPKSDTSVTVGAGAGDTSGSWTPGI